MENNKQKLFVFDLDGTLLNSDHELSHENIDALVLAKKNNHLIAMATGRNYIFAKKAINNNWNIFDYYIGCNGAILHNISKNEHFNSSKMIDYSLVDLMLGELKKFGGGIQVSTVWNIYADVYVTDEAQWFNQEDKKIYFTSWNSINTMSEEEKKHIVQVSLHLEETKVNDFKEQMVKKYQYDFSITSKFNIDINIKGLNKLFGIKYIVKENNIDKNNVYVFGDTQNDIEGLKYYRNSFAMENALDEVKSVANETIGDNNSNAIALKVLENI